MRTERGRTKHTEIQRKNQRKIEAIKGLEKNREVYGEKTQVKVKQNRKKW